MKRTTLALILLSIAGSEALTQDYYGPPRQPRWLRGAQMERCIFGGDCRRPRMPPRMPPFRLPPRY